MLWNLFLGVVIVCIVLTSICVILTSIILYKSTKEYEDSLEYEEDEDEDISERTK